MCVVQYSLLDALAVFLAVKIGDNSLTITRTISVQEFSCGIQ
jgi:hypothetical protein